MCNFFNGRSTVEQSPSNRSQLYLTPSRSLTVVNSLRTRTRFTARQSFPPARTPAQAQADRATPGCRGRCRIDPDRGRAACRRKQNSTPTPPSHAVGSNKIDSCGSCVVVCVCVHVPVATARCRGVESTRHTNGLKGRGDSLGNGEAAKTQYENVLVCDTVVSGVQTLESCLVADFSETNRTRVYIMVVLP